MPEPEAAQEQKAEMGRGAAACDESVDNQPLPGAGASGGDGASRSSSAQLAPLQDNVVPAAHSTNGVLGGVIVTPAQPCEPDNLHSEQHLTPGQVEAEQVGQAENSEPTGALSRVASPEPTPQDALVAAVEPDKNSPSEDGLTAVPPSLTSGESASSPEDVHTPPAQQPVLPRPQQAAFNRNVISTPQRHVAASMPVSQPTLQNITPRPAPTAYPPQPAKPQYRPSQHIPKPTILPAGRAKSKTAAGLLEELLPVARDNIRHSPAALEIVRRELERHAELSTHLKCPGPYSRTYHANLEQERKNQAEWHARQPAWLKHLSKFHWCFRPTICWSDLGVHVGGTPAQCSACLLTGINDDIAMMKVHAHFTMNLADRGKIAGETPEQEQARKLYCAQSGYQC